MTRTTGPATAIEIAHDAFVSTSEAIDYRVDHDMATAILTFGDRFFALSENYSDGEFDGYSWAWGIETRDESDRWGTTTETFGEGGGPTESEARAAVAEWIATVTK